MLLIVTFDGFVIVTVITDVVCFFNLRGRIGNVRFWEVEDRDFDH